MRPVLARDVTLVAEIDRRRSAIAVLAETPSTTPSRRGATPKVVNGIAGAPASVADTGRPVSAYSWLQPSRSCIKSFSRQPRSVDPPICAPMTERNELVVCWATIRFSDYAPVSVKPFCVPV